MKKTLLMVALAALALAAGPALAQKKQLAIVVPGRDNPFFASVGDGCDRWNAAHKDSAYECTYNGPASSVDRFGEVQIVDDLITTGAAAIAIAPADPAAMAKLLGEKRPAMPIITIATDLATGDRALRKTLLVSDDYLTGVKLAELIATWKPGGGTICLQLDKPDSGEVNARAAGVRDTLAGAKDAGKLTGLNNWSEATGCPLYAEGKADLANRQLAETLAANPSLDAVVLADGTALTAPQAYAKAVASAAERLKAKALVIVAADTPTLPFDALKAGRVHAEVDQRPIELGRTAPDVMVQLINGETVADPTYTGLDTCTADTLASCRTK